MSINNFSSSGLPDAIWWMQNHAMNPNTHTNINSSSSHHQLHHQSRGQVWHDSQQSASMLQSRNPCRNFNLNNNSNIGDDDDEDPSSAVGMVEKEAMFEKPLTPSDVGKLNRLVIPKQHAERYFPLGGDSGDKGLILSFEDEGGKCWRFRYSYWNSSQSYVLTKGWSRYVKEKQLDAGDIVFFERHRTDGEQFFIGWRRRNAPVQGGVSAAQPSTVATGGGDQWTRGFYPAHPYPARSPAVALPHQPDYCAHAGTGSGTKIVPTRVPAGNLKRLRLFGVNMECQSEEYEPSTPDGSSSVSSHGAAHYHHHHYSSQACAPNHQNQMDYTSYSGNVKQQTRRGR